jgi:hypothetical protein
VTGPDPSPRPPPQPSSYVRPQAQGFVFHALSFFPLFRPYCRARLTFAATNSASPSCPIVFNPWCGLEGSDTTAKPFRPTPTRPFIALYSVCLAHGSSLGRAAQLPWLVVAWKSTPEFLIKARMHTTIFYDSVTLSCGGLVTRLIILRR